MNDNYNTVNVTIRSRSGRKKLSYEQEVEIAKEYNNGSTMQILAEKYSVSISTIRNTLLRFKGV